MQPSSINNLNECCVEKLYVMMEFNHETFELAMFN